jgi:phosphoribosyl-ATP pyrophosphohydrolase/phosphoribosyl-AMP cyclohydrolase
MIASYFKGIYNIDIFFTAKGFLTGTVQMIKKQIMNTINFNKNNDGLVPAVIQDVQTNEVLMLGYMNEEAYNITQKKNLVTFFSRSRKSIWTKGETSGNFLEVKEILMDCDNDTLLIKALPSGPTCHTGNYSCFCDTAKPPFSLSYLEEVIKQRKSESPDKSYTSRLLAKGINKIAQKVGEEAVELVIEAKDQNDELFTNEAADLLFHYLILLNAKGFSLNNIITVLAERHR